MSVIRKLAGQTAIYGIPSILGRTLNFLLAYLHLDVFPPESYGVTVELYAYLSFVMLFLLYGMETAFFRFAQTEPQTKVFNTLQTGLYGSTIIFLVGSLWSHKDLASGLGYASQANYFVWLILIIAFDVLAAVPLARLRFLQKPFTFVFINVTGIFTNIGINVFVLVYWFPQYFSGNTDFFLSSWFNPEIGVGYIFIANLIASGVKYGLTLFWGLPNPINFSWNLWKKALNYAWPLIFTGFAGLINEVADRILLGRILTPKLGVEAARYQIGVYGGCYKLAIIINICVQAFRYAAEPFFFQQLKDRSDRNMVQVLNYLAAFTLLVFIGISLYIDFFKLFLRNPKYWEGLDVVPILLLANCFLALHIQISMWYKLADKTGAGAIIAGIGAIITVALNLLLIPIMGYMGAALTTLLVYMLLPLLSLIWSRKHYYIPYDLGKLAIFFSLAVGIVGLGYYLFPQMHFGLKALLIFLYIVVFCWVEKPLRKHAG